MIQLTAKGDLSKTTGFIDRILKRDLYTKLDVYGQRGVEALAAETPKKSGVTAASWYYSVEKTDNGVEVNWYNTNTNKNVNIAIIIQYGHGTGTGGYVQGIDYINPAIRPIFEDMVNDIWGEVTG